MQAEHLLKLFNIKKKVPNAGAPEGDEMKVFWVVFILALLFVIGSASALRYFGNPARKTDADDSEKK